MTRTCIPLKQRKEMAGKPFYTMCALAGHLGHECEGRITWEHAIIVAGKSYQAEWAIPPLCEKSHAVDNFQDAGTMIKEINEWIAYSRATDEDLLKICGDSPGTDPRFAKSKYHFQRKKYLINKYGVWTPKVPL